MDAKDATKFTRVIRDLGSQFGYEYDLKNLPTERTITAGENDGDADVVTYGERINLLETFSDENIDHARRMATVTWGDGSFAADGPMTIREFSVANGTVTNHVPPRYTPEGKQLLRDRMHSKFMAHQVLHLFNEDARRVLEIEWDLFTWTSADGRETERDGLSLVAIILSRMKPHFNVDMWKELSKIKGLTLKQFGDNPAKYLDEMKLMKLSIDEKDPAAYPDKMYVKDILAQLVLAPVDSFALEYERLHTSWLRGKEHLTSASLRREAITHYTQLVNDDKWSGRMGARDQVVVLTTKMNVMTAELTRLAASGGGGGKPTAAPKTEAGKAITNRFTIHEWRLKKINNGKEFGEITNPDNPSDKRPYYFCEDGHYSDGKKVGMYCIHKPGAGHKEWEVNKLARRKEDKERRGKRDRESPALATQPPTPVVPTNDANKKRLALSDNIQAALTTQLGVDPDHWKSIWDDACAETGN